MEERLKEYAKQLRLQNPSISAQELNAKLEEFAKTLPNDNANYSVSPTTNIGMSLMPITGVVERARDMAFIGKGLQEDPEKVVKGFFNNAPKKFLGTIYEMAEGGQNLVNMTLLSAGIELNEYITGDEYTADEKLQLKESFEDLQDFASKITRVTNLLGGTPYIPSVKKTREIKDSIFASLPQYENTISEEIAKGRNADWGQIGERIATDAVGSLPYTLASFWYPTMIYSGISVAGNKWEEEFVKNPDENAGKLAANAMITGGVEILDGLVSRYVFRQAGVLGSKAGERGIKAMNKSIGTKIATAFFGEGATEMAQAATNQLNDSLFFDREMFYTSGKGFNMKKLYEIFDEGIIGAFSGGGITSVRNAFDTNSKKKNRAIQLLTARSEQRAIRENMDAVIELNKQFAKETSMESKALVRREIIEKLANIKKIQSRARIAVETLEGPQLIEYAKNIDLINRIDRMEAPSLSFRSKRDKAVQANELIYKQNLQDKLSSDIGFAKEVEAQVGLETTVVQNTQALQEIIKKETGRVVDFNGTAGVFIGQGRIYINKDVALQQGAVTVGSHEILHPILNAMVGNAKSQTDIVKSFKNIIGGGKNTLVEELLERRGITLEANPTKYYTEYLTAFSDLVNSNQISFEEQSYWERLVNLFDRIFNNKGFTNIDFQSGRGVYNFLKEYSKSVKEGKLSDKVMSSIDIDRVKAIGTTSQEFQNSKEADVVNNLYNENGKTAAFEIAEKYRGMAMKIASKYRDVPGYTTMSDVLIDEILTGTRGVYNLVQTYNPDSGVPLAAYINKFLPSRAIEAANQILDTEFTVDVTEARGITEKQQEEVIQEEERVSLRNSLGLTQPIVDKVKNSVIKTFGARLPKVTSPQFFKSLQNSYRVELKPTIAKMMGRQEGYREFLENNFQLIYNVIPQSTFNKRFKDFTEAVTDESGKQLREKTAEGKGIFKKKKISKQEFVDYFLGDNVGTSTKGTRKTALAEALAQEIAFDATMDVIKTPEVIEKINFINGFQENFIAEVARQIDRGSDFQFSRELQEARIMDNVALSSDGTLNLENFPIFKAAVEKEMQNLNISSPKGVGGTIFEFYFQAKGNKLNIVGVKFEGDAKMGNTGVDGVITVTRKNDTQQIGIELKMFAGAEFGSGVVKYDNGNVSFTKGGQMLGMYENYIKEKIPFYNQVIDEYNKITGENKPYKFPQRLNFNAMEQAKKIVGTKNLNIDLKGLDPSRIITHYNKKGVNYIYIGDKGMYYLGSNPNKMKGIQPFEATAGLYVSLRSSNSKGNGAQKTSDFNLRGVNRIDANTLQESIKIEDSNFADIFDYSKETGILSEEFNNILEQKTGILSDKIYTNVTKVTDRLKRPGNFFVPYSAEDFMGLMYATVPKGKDGDKALGWIKTNLINPYSVAMENINRERMQMMNDFKGLKKKLKNVPGQLNKNAGNTNYTNETAIRVWVWNQQGMEIPGLPDADKNTLVDYVNNNKDFVDFGNQLIQINKAEGYTKPSESWNVGTITTDLLENLNDAKRKKHLEQWQNNVNEIFSSDNKNKLEAAFGKGYVKSLNNILRRMETGRNRNGGGNTQIDNWLDWLNNSVGAIMFLNVRSAVLQTISTVNYMNWHDNNPLKAAQAFANQPQFWSDFSMIFNSDFLTERRGGTKLNVQENEIAEMANKGGVKGAISYLLNKGFVLTRAADSFAIASGGAAMYRNRVNSYIKQGMDQKQAEEQAFRDFREITEEAQQSSRPDRISMEQAGGFGRLFLAFANTPMQYTRLMKKSAQDIINKRGDQKTNWSKLMYYGAIQNFIFNALQKALFAIGFEDEKDENQSAKVNSVAEGMLDSVLRGTGVAGNAVVAGKNFAVDLARRSQKPRPNFEDATWKLFDVSPPIDSKITKIRAALRTVDWQGDEIMDKGISLDNPGAMATAQFISATTNVPLDRVLRLYDNTRAAVAEDTEAWQRVALLLGWSTWELGIKEEEDKKLEIKNNKSKLKPKKLKPTKLKPTKLK